MKNLLRIAIPLLILLVLLMRWSRTRSEAPELRTNTRNDAQALISSHRDGDTALSGNGSASSRQREHNEREAETNSKITDVEDFTEEDLVHEHVIHTIAPRGSSVVIAGERDDQGKRIFTLLTPQAGDPEMPRGQIKLSSRNYALDDAQIDQAGMRTLLGNESRLHNLGEIWSADDIKNTQARWPDDAALSMPTVVLESGAEGTIEIGSLGTSSELFRAKVRIHETADGFELQATIQTYRRK